MRVFLDTELTSLQAPRLIAMGLAASDGRECYAELPADPSLANEFVRQRVLPQLGIVPARVASSAELGRRIGDWLIALQWPTIPVVFDFPLDYDLLEQALRDGGRWNRLQGLLVPTRVGQLMRLAAGHEAMVRSWARSLAADGIGRHHALADARALHAGYDAVYSPARSTTLQRFQSSGAPPTPESHLTWVAPSSTSP